MDKKKPPEILPLFPGDKTTNPVDGISMDELGEDEEYVDAISFPGAKVHPEGAQMIFPTPPPLADPMKIDEKQVKLPKWFYENFPIDDADDK